MSVLVTNTKAFSSLVTEQILFRLDYISLLFLIDVISVNTGKCIIFVNSARH